MTLLQAPPRRGYRRRVAAIGAALTCAGCGVTPPTAYLALHPLAPETVSPAVPAAPVRVLAVRVPPWLDRMEVVRATDGALVKVESLARWSAPVGDLALSALTEDLVQRLPGVQVLPARTAAPLLARDVSVELTTMEQRGGTLQLTGTASLSDAQTGALLLNLPLQVSAPAPASARDEAAILDGLLAKIADRLATALRSPATARQS